MALERASLGGEPSGKESDEIDVQQSATSVKVFVPGAEVKWTAQTHSAKMREFVESRELIFERQRELDLPELQAASEKLAKDHLAKFSKGNDVPRGNMNAYKRFCDSVDVPPYPITFPLPSLAMFARCSTKNGHFSTFKADVQHVREAMASAWEGEGGYQALVAMDDEGVALKEFMAERRKVRVKESWRTRSSQSRPTKRLGPPSEPSSASETDSEDESSEEEEEEQEDAQVLENVVQTPTPGLPRPGDSYASPQEALAQVVKAVVPVYGVSARIENSDESSADIYCNRHNSHYKTKPGGCCPFRIHLDVDERSASWTVDRELSHYEHNHNRDPRIVADPTWRPTIRMKLARKALGVGPLIPKRSQSGKRRKVVEEPSSEASETESSDEEDEDDVGATAKSVRKVKAAASAATPSLSRSRFRAGSSSIPYTPPTPQSIVNIPSSRQNLTGPFAIPSRFHVADTLSPVELVASFLAATNPSHIHLAPALVEAGFGSVGALTVLGYHSSPHAQAALLQEVERRLKLGEKL